MIHLTPAKKAYLWTVSVLVAFVLILAGLPKIFGGQDWARNFELWGYPGWFRVLVGIVEVLGAILLVNHRTALFAAGVLTVLMAGATYTQLISGSVANAMIPMILAILTLTVVIARWPHPTEETGKLGEATEPPDDDEESPVAA